MDTLCANPASITFNIRAGESESSIAHQSRMITITQHFERISKSKVANPPFFISRAGPRKPHYLRYFCVQRSQSSIFNQPRRTTKATSFLCPGKQFHHFSSVEQDHENHIISVSRAANTVVLIKRA